MGKVKQARRRLGLSQVELAEAASVSPATVVEIELGHRQPQGRTLRKLAAALGVEVASLIDEEETEAPKAQAPPQLEGVAGLPFDADQAAREAIEEAGAETEEERFAAIDEEYARRLEGWSREDLQELYKQLNQEALLELANVWGRGTREELDRQYQEWRESASYRRYRQASAGRYSVAVALRALDRADLLELASA